MNNQLHLLLFINFRVPHRKTGRVPDAPSSQPYYHWRRNSPSDRILLWRARCRSPAKCYPSVVSKRKSSQPNESESTASFFRLRTGRTLTIWHLSSPTGSKSISSVTIERFIQLCSLMHRSHDRCPFVFVFVMFFFFLTVLTLRRLP